VLSRVRRNLSYANVMATIAVFVALGGGAYAASQINGAKLKNRSVAGAKIKKGALGGTEVNESRLGKVPAAGQADHAVSADRAASVPAEDWHTVGGPNEPGFLNNWHNDSADETTAGFFKDPFGVVHLKGIIKRDGPYTGHAVFLLPAADRPAKTVFIHITCDGANAGLTITDGQVTVSGISQETCVLENVTFRAGES
jgi:hypothetical protein